MDYIQDIKDSLTLKELSTWGLEGYQLPYDYAHYYWNWFNDIKLRELGYGGLFSNKRTPPNIFPYASSLMKFDSFL